MSEVEKKLVIKDKSKLKSKAIKMKKKIKRIGMKNDENVIEAGNFNIIRGIRLDKKESVYRSLPQWLKTPNVVSSNIKDHKVPCDTFKHLLDDDTMNNLKENKIDSFFPVQSQLIKELLENASQMTCHFPIGGVPMSDICCSAPTGSGKTLAFVIPIVQILKRSTFRALRCLVVVPIIELASQVYKVFKTFTNNTNLKVGLANGLKSFSAEQSTLIDYKGPYGSVSKVDILVCTPGRLVDHLHSSDHFNLSQLRFLVIDEADRMMEEVKQDWLIHVERAVHQSTNHIASNSDDKEDNQPKFTLHRYHSKPSLSSLILNYPITSSSLSLLIDNTHSNYSSSSSSSLLLPSLSSSLETTATVNSIQKPRIQLQKLLFSATLSHNPEKLQLMKLYNPKLFTSVARNDKSVLKRRRDEDEDEKVMKKMRKDDDDDDDKDESKELNKAIKNEKNLKNEYLGKYVTPIGLKENFIEVDKSRKPLVLLHVLKTLGFKSVLCFTNSVQSTNRLCTLMKLLSVKACEFSSNLHISKRDRVVKQFNSGKLNLMVCSDAMSRGLDLDNVDCVVSYDVPSSLKTYIHRIGRTARAGNEGNAIALLEKKEIQYFKRLLKEAGKNKIKELKVNQSKLKPYTTQYQKGLTMLSKSL